MRTVLADFLLVHVSPQRDPFVLVSNESHRKENKAAEDGAAGITA